MIKILFAALMVTTLLSCKHTQKITDADEFGKEIFGLFKNGKKDQVVDYIITKNEVKKVFKATKEYQNLSESQQEETVNSVYDRTLKYATQFIKYYSDTTNNETIALQKGIVERVSSHTKLENGPPAMRIKVLFSAEGKKYWLLLDASKVDDYCKLLSWIEVKEAFGE